MSGLGAGMADGMTWMQNGADFVFGEQWAWSPGVERSVSKDVGPTGTQAQV